MSVSTMEPSITVREAVMRKTGFRSGVEGRTEAKGGVVQFLNSIYKAQSRVGYLCGLRINGLDTERQLDALAGDLAGWNEPITGSSGGLR